MPRSGSILYFIIYLAIGFIYPAYCSMVALETKDSKDDIAWLMYWVVFALFNFVEYFGDFMFSWFPLFPLVKLGFLSWCVAPIGQNGAFYLYKVFIQPFFRMYGRHIDYYFTQVVEISKDATNYFPSYPK